MHKVSGLTRRALLAGMAASTFALALARPARSAVLKPLIEKPIPSSGETIPNVGLGSWITFNVGDDRRAIAESTDVIRAFLKAGGRMIDSSPMYGSAQDTIGEALRTIADTDGLFATDKVWTNGAGRGRQQIAETGRRWGVDRFSLLQVHNLRGWQQHLPTLFAMKEQGDLTYVGVTTSHGRRHGDLLRIMESEPIDFVQLTYNMDDREVEARLLPAAAANGVAVICNRPFDGGRLVRAVKRHSFPRWASDAGFSGWPDFLLKYITAHPAVTCAIPATTKVAHLQENMAATQGNLPDKLTRARMLAALEAL